MHQQKKLIDMEMNHNQLNNKEMDESIVCVVPIEDDEFFLDNIEIYLDNATEMCYPSASAAYSSPYDADESVSLIDKDFLDMIESLAEDDNFLFNGPSPVAYALPSEFQTTAVSYAVPKQCVSISEEDVRVMPVSEEGSKSSFVAKAHSEYSSICHAEALAIELSSDMLGKCSETAKEDDEVVLAVPENLTDILDKKAYHRKAISRWKRKQETKKDKTRKCATSAKVRCESYSARREASAKRERVNGKFKQIQTKWMPVTAFYDT